MALDTRLPLLADKPDLFGGVQRGIGLGQSIQAERRTQEAFPLLQAGREQNLAIGEQNLATGALQQQAAGINIENAQQLQAINQAKGLSAMLDQLQSIPDIPSRIRAFQGMQQSIEALGGNFAQISQDFDPTDQGLAGARQDLAPILALAPRAAAAKPTVVAKGGIAIDAAGNVIASNAGAQQAPVIPESLIADLSPELAKKASDAFTAAGGGKDGLAVFTKVVDRGTENEKRIVSPKTLQVQFPKASPAEFAQLQGVMDTAETVEKGLKQASTLRDKQRKDKKGKVFQQRAVDLLNKIKENSQLGDVLGGIEGARGGKAGGFLATFGTSDEEADAIADIEEAQDILTADNLDIMSGVLSETDIKIIANLAGGALNRTRSEGRFIEGLDELIVKLSENPILTADDIANQRIGNTPPSGRTGGQLMTDAQGNKAFVFPDGSVEEVQ